MNLDALEWKEAVWEAPDGTFVNHYVADISYLFAPILEEPYTVKLCKWRSTYSINLMRFKRMVIGIRQITHTEFETSPDLWLLDAERIFEGALTRESIGRDLDAIERKHWGMHP